MKEGENQIFNLIKKELERQRNSIELIASENFTSDASYEDSPYK